MRIFQSHPALRWVVPAVVVGVVGGTSLIAVSANAHTSLPDESAQQLLVDLQQAKVDSFSGTVVQTSNLGLPEIPGVGGGQYDTSLTSLISGTHTLQVWAAGPDKQRLAIHGTLGETDLIRNGSDVWNWSSRDNAATHTTLSAHERTQARQGDSSEAPSTPQEAATKALSALTPTTDVTVDPSVTVADRPAYALVLTPKDSGSLIGQVRIAVDGDKKVPLEVEVLATDGTSVFDTKFDTIDFGTPDNAYFTFNPPAGVKVTEKQAPTSGQPTAKQRADAKKAAESAPKPKVVGQGWSSVVVAKADLDQATSGSDTKGKHGSDQAGQLQQMLNALPKVSGSWGSGRLLSSKAFSVVITDDGRIAAGAVAPEKLYEALG